MTTTWETYEHAAAKVVENLRRELGVSKVEGKQELIGESGTTWEIDARAWTEGQEGFLVIEVRRHTKAGLSQEQLGAIAYRVQDLGAKGGIVVSPLPPQKGANIVAAHANVEHILLAPDSVPERYLAQFMGRTFHGVSVVETAHATDRMDATLIRGKEENT